MNELTIFSNPEFGEVRTTTVNGEPWFVGKDVAKALGYSNTSKALQDNISEKHKGVTKVTTFGGVQDAVIIDEAGLYKLVFGSRLPDAERFTDWVTAEVLPSIRKNGGYIMNQNELTDEELMAKAYIVAQKTIENKNKQLEAMRHSNRLLEKEIEENKPKVLFADAVEASESSVLVRELAIVLKQNGVNIGQNRLFDWLRQKGYLVKGGKSRNCPTQKSMEMGLFELKETAITLPGGQIDVRKTPLVTGKGQQYFINKFLGGLANDI